MSEPENAVTVVTAENATETRPDPQPVEEPVEELLVEEVSIDGMCGVY